MDEWVWSNGGMILTGENWSAGRKTLYSVGGRWMDGYGATVEWYWQGKTEVLGEKHYTAWVVDEWMGMGHWWNGTDRGNLKYWEKNLNQREFVHHNSHIVCPGIEPWFMRWYDGDWSLDAWHALKKKVDLTYINIQSVPRSKHTASRL